MKPHNIIPANITRHTVVKIVHAHTLNSRQLDLSSRLEIFQVDLKCFNST